MIRRSRSSVVSSFTIVKGALIDESYSVFANWDASASKRANLDRLRETNYIGAASDTWLRDVRKCSIDGLTRLAPIARCWFSPRRPTRLTDGEPSFCGT